MYKLQLIAEYFIQNIIIIKDIFIFSVLAAIPFGIFLDMNGWYLENSRYITIIGYVIAVDHLFGTIVHLFYKKDFSFIRNLMGLGMKLFVVVMMGGLFEAFAQLTMEDDLIYRYLKMMTRILVFGYPFRSAAINCSTVTKGIFPPEALIKLFTKFNQDLDINIFKPKNKQDEQDSSN
jgi:hypothetical protein